MKIGVVVGVCAVLAGAAYCAQPWPTETAFSLETQSGLLRALFVGTGSQLWLGPSMIGELDESDPAVAARWPQDAPPRILLIDIPTDGGSCGNLYRLLDVSPGGKPVLTRTFGNCAVTASVSVSGDQVTIEFPATTHTRARSWQYDLARRRLQDPLHGTVTGPLL